MIFWAINEVGTDRYMPVMRRPCHTSSRPISVTKAVPRLFTTERGAKNALTWWKKGETRLIRSGGGYEDPYDYSERHSTRARPERARVQLQVVALELTGASGLENP